MRFLARILTAILLGLLFKLLGLAPAAAENKVAEIQSGLDDQTTFCIPTGAPPTISGRGNGVSSGCRRRLWPLALIRSRAQSTSVIRWKCDWPKNEVGEERSVVATQKIWGLDGSFGRGDRRFLIEFACKWDHLDHA